MIRNKMITPLRAANFNLVTWSGQSRMPWESIKYKLSRRLTWTGIETLFYSEKSLKSRKIKRSMRERVYLRWLRGLGMKLNPADVSDSEIAVVNSIVYQVWVRDYIKRHFLCVNDLRAFTRHTCVCPIAYVKYTRHWPWYSPHSGVFYCTIWKVLLNWRDFTINKHDQIAACSLRHGHTVWEQSEWEKERESVCIKFNSSIHCRVDEINHHCIYHIRGAVCLRIHYYCITTVVVIEFLKSN